MSRLHRHILRVYVGEIVGGVAPPGTKLPREADIAQQFSVSRGVARESIRGLEERGLVEVKHGRGATVLPEESWDVFNPDVLAALLHGERGAAVLTEYLECRRILEIEAAALAAQRASGQQLSGLSDTVARMTASSERAPRNPAAEDLYHDADIEFHRLIFAATGNRALARMTEPIHRALAAARRPLARPQFRMDRSLPEHKRILAAVADRDPEEARAAMRDHLLTVEGYLREYAEAVSQRAAAAETGR